MMVLCMDKNLIREMREKFVFISYEEMDGILYPLFSCDDVSLVKNYIDSGSCIEYDIMTF